MAYAWMTLENGWRALYYTGLPWDAPVLHGLITRDRLVAKDKIAWTEPPDFSRRRPEVFRSRLETLRAVLGTGEWGTVYLRQVHGRTVWWNPAPTLESPAEGDGMLTDRREILLVVTVADCLPIWIVDPEIEAVGLLHAGWRSTAAGIVGEALETLLAQGSHLNRTRLIIGPGIQKCCFEVGIEVIETIHERYPDIAPYVLHESRRRWFADLVALNVVLARRYGLGRHQIHPLRICTRCNPHLFYSHRNGDAERMLAFIGRKS